MKDFTAHSVLVVEDSSVQREHVTGLLRAIGFGTILSANDGIDALRTLEERGQPVDLVLTDLDMPGMDGMELIQQLVSRRLAANLIAASANHARLPDVARSLPPGTTMHMLATLPKPVRLEPLQALLEEVSLLTLPELAVQSEQAASHAEIAAALQAGQIVPLYAPRVLLDSGRLLGVALRAYWQHPERGLQPLELLPADVVQELVRQAAGHVQHWQEMGLPALRLSLPLPVALLEDLGELGRLAATLQAAGIKPAGVCWEISEAVVAQCAPDVLHNLSRLVLRGYGAAAVRCGRYEADLREYACFPLMEMSIDSLFVHEAAQRSHRRPLLEGLLSIAAKLGVPAGCEGIARQEDWALMRELGCSVGQGPLVGAPMPADELLAWWDGSMDRLRSSATYRVSGAAPPAAGTA